MNRDSSEVSFYVASGWRWAYIVVALLAIALIGMLILAGAEAPTGMFSTVALALMVGLPFLFGGKGKPILTISDAGVFYSTGANHAGDFFEAERIENILDNGDGVLLKLRDRKKMMGISTKMLAKKDREPAKKALMDWFAYRQMMERRTRRA